MQDFPTSPVPRSWLMLHWLHRSAAHSALLTGKRTSSQIKPVESVEHDSMLACQDVMTLADRTPPHSFPFLFHPFSVRALIRFNMWIRAAWGKSGCCQRTAARTTDCSILLCFFGSMLNLWPVLGPCSCSENVEYTLPTHSKQTTIRTSERWEPIHQMTCFQGWHWWKLWDWNPQDSAGKFWSFWTNMTNYGMPKEILSARLRGNWPSYWSKPSDSSVASVKTKTHPVNSGNRKLNAGERFHILPFGENSSSSIFRIYLLVCGMWITPIDWHLGILHCHNVGSWESSEVSVQKIIRIKPMWWGPHTSSCKSMQNLLSAISCEQILAICHKGSHRVHSVARWWQWVYSLDYPFWPGCDAFSKHTLKRYLRKKLILSWKSWGGRWDAGRHAK